MSPIILLAASALSALIRIRLKARDCPGLQARWSRPNTEALAGLDELYTSEAMYFGKKSNKDEVVKDKLAFARKFPQRDYRPKEPISVSCYDPVCEVSGLVDFRSVDPVAKIVSEGTATFQYELLLLNGTMKISLENGQVLKRNRTPLALTSDPGLSIGAK